MFLGTHQLRLDDKGRLVLPAKFRPDLENGVVVTRGQEHCLVLFSQGEFATVHEKASRAPITNKGARDYLRVFMSAASAEVPDKQWRITIPQILRRYAGLGRDVAVIGVGNRAEIWDVEAWEAYLAQTEGEFADREDEVIDGIL